LGRPSRLLQGSRGFWTPVYQVCQNLFFLPSPWIFRESICEFFGVQGFFFFFLNTSNVPRVILISLQESIRCTL
jgi:hypothetical protein